MSWVVCGSLGVWQLELRNMHCYDCYEVFNDRRCNAHSFQSPETCDRDTSPERVNTNLEGLLLPVSFKAKTGRLSQAPRTCRGPHRGDLRFVEKPHGHGGCCCCWVCFLFRRLVSDQV